MMPLTIEVLTATVVSGRIETVIRARRIPHADILLRLQIPIVGPTDILEAARDEALKYLDIA